MPAKFDEGQPMYESDRYAQLLPHTVTLTRLHRQNEESKELFIAVLEDLRLGKCCGTTAEYIKNNLNRPTHCPKPLHLYLTNIETDAHNAEQLHLLEGRREEFVASDWGRVDNIQCPTGKRVYFKAGAPVVVVYNISESIHNGTRATFLAKDGDDAFVKIDGVAVRIKRKTWSTYNAEGRIIGVRCQIPLKLFWATTVNKAQGQELDGVCFHSSYEFTGGLIYTALSRVKKASDVKVRDFKRSHVKGRDSDIAKINSLQNQSFEADCGCCTNTVSAENHEHAVLRSEGVDDVVEHEANSSEVMESVAKTFFGTNDHVDEDTEELVDLNSFLDNLEESQCFVGDPPEDFDLKAFLLSFKDNSRLAEPGSFAAEKNDLIEELVSCERKFRNVGTYINIIWRNTSGLVKKFIKDNPQQTQISRAQFTKVSQEVWKSNAEKQNHTMLRSVFEVKGSDKLTEAMFSLGANFTYGVYQNIIHLISEEVRAHQPVHNEHKTFTVEEMDNSGKSKVHIIK